MVSTLIDVGILVLVLLIGLLLGYLVGSLIAAIFRRVLNIRELKEQIAESGIISLGFWNNLVRWVGTYIKVLFVALLLNYVVRVSAMSAWYTELSKYTEIFQSIMGGIGVFLVFAIVGTVIAAIIYRVIKGILEAARVEEKMAKHGMSGALGGLSLTKVIAGIFAAYIIIVFLAQGVTAGAAAMVTAQPASETGTVIISTISTPLQDMFDGLVKLYPQFVLGLLVIIIGALVGDFVQEQFNKSKSTLLTGTMAGAAKALIIFFAVVIALPKFTFVETTILEDSFKIIVAGLSIGLAIAMGLGLKDMFSDLGKKMEKKL
jgi:hypothetical protein